jgi:hypothetical protein
LAFCGELQQILQDALLSLIGYHRGLIYKNDTIFCLGWARNALESTPWYLNRDVQDAMQGEGAPPRIALKDFCSPPRWCSKDGSEVNHSQSSDQSPNQRCLACACKTRKQHGPHGWSIHHVVKEYLNSLRLTSCQFMGQVISDSSLKSIF